MEWFVLRVAMNAIGSLHVQEKEIERTVQVLRQSKDVGELDALGVCSQHLLDELVPFDIRDGLHRERLGGLVCLDASLPR